MIQKKETNQTVSTWRCGTRACHVAFSLLHSYLQTDGAEMAMFTFLRHWDIGLSKLTIEIPAHNYDKHDKTIGGIQRALSTGQGLPNFHHDFGESRRASESVSV